MPSPEPRPISVTPAGPSLPTRVFVRRERRRRVPLLWKVQLLFLPLLFLPNLAVGRQTSYGFFELSDYLIIPYLAFIWGGRSRVRCRRLDLLCRLLLVFVGWGVLGVLSINFRFDYGADDHQVYFSLLKLAKLVLFGLAGVITARRVGISAERREFHWAVLAAISVIAVSVLLGPGKGASLEAAKMGYKSYNEISVAVVILVCYVGGLLVSGYGSKRWRRVALAVVALGLVGSLVSGGRGGWVAALLASPFLLRGRGRSARVAGLIIALLTTAYISYRIFPTFRERFDFTISPDPDYLVQYGSGVAGFDDGERLEIWLVNVKRLVDVPLFGTGFYHREGLQT